MFIGREKELRELSALWDKRTASVVTCRGRRRFGKSTLIDEFANRPDFRCERLLSTTASWCPLSKPITCLTFQFRSEICSSNSKEEMK